MRVFLISLLFVLLVQQAKSQQNGGSQTIGSPSMGFVLEFSPVNNATSNLNLSGWADYGRIVHYPNFGTIFQSYTNDLAVTILLPATPNSIWLYEQKKDGSFKPFAEVTNYLVSGDVTYVQQHFALTKKQIHSLISTNWYVEVDFGDNQYISRLTPDYQMASGPISVFDFLSPVFWHESEYGYVVIAQDNRSANVIISGTKSIDPYYFPMGYTWVRNLSYLGPLIQTNTGPVFRSNFEVGNFYVRLQAHDVITNGTSPIINLAIYTPAQAIDFISPAVQSLALPEEQIAKLNARLSQAAYHFNQGKIAAGRRELIAFIVQIKTANVSGSAATWILKYSQRLLEALN